MTKTAEDFSLTSYTCVELGGAHFSHLLDKVYYNTLLFLNSFRECGNMNMGKKLSNVVNTSYRHTQCIYYKFLFLYIYGYDL
jgi:hypothetical protein